MRGSCRLPSNDILQSPSTKVLLLLLLLRRCKSFTFAVLRNITGCPSPLPRSGSEFALLDSRSPSPITLTIPTS
ncbi:hypothetical protein ASPTUDRAFT_345248 [Aspergillus tubingensis CBS 134.48]|uniref:Secreted protein n=1 Tax=Aspergillus tubingensis (strain CBS 134.48) TaxID=767770 RepID=A0A1L9NKY4_ASPTC|nr:hypothetical protein ASPTUDRAFT_345248 [Aspergillus tubingensis CBS 134.48]